MSSAAISDDRQRASIPGILANELVAASAAHSSDRVIIAGTDQLEFLITLLRRGFANVDCMSASDGPPLHAGEADIVIAPSVQGEADLLHILQRFGCTLRPRGVLVLHEASPVHDERRMRQFFFSSGFAAVERVPSVNGFGHHWCAYKQNAAAAQAA